MSNGIFNGKKGWLIYTRDCSLSIICSFTQETVHAWVEGLE